MTKQLRATINACSDCPYMEPGFPSGHVCGAPEVPGRVAPHWLHEPSKVIPDWCPLPEPEGSNEGEGLISRFNDFLFKKIEAGASARIVLKPSGYAERYGKKVVIEIRLDCDLPLRVDDFPNSFDDDNNAAVALFFSHLGGGRNGVVYGVWY